MFYICYRDLIKTLRRILAIVVNLRFANVGLGNIITSKCIGINHPQKGLLYYDEYLALTAKDIGMNKTLSGRSA